MLANKTIKDFIVNYISPFFFSIFLLGYLIETFFCLPFDVTVPSFLLLLFFTYLLSWKRLKMPSKLNIYSSLFLIFFLCIYVTSLNLSGGSTLSAVRLFALFLLPVLMTNYVDLQIKSKQIVYILAFIIGIYTVVFVLSLIGSFLLGYVFIEYRNNRFFLMGANPIAFSWQTCICFFSACFFFLHCRINNKRIFFIKGFLSLLLFFNVFFLVLSGSRGAILSFLVVFISYVGFIKKNKFVVRKKIYLLCALVILAVMSSCIINKIGVVDRFCRFTYYDVKQLVAGSGEYDETNRKWGLKWTNDEVNQMKTESRAAFYLSKNVGPLTMRYICLKKIFKLGMEKPFIGFGDKSMRQGGLAYPHNMLLSVFFKSGFLGLFSFIMFLFFALYLIGVNLQYYKSKELMTSWQLQVCFLALICFLFISRQFSGTLMMSKDMMILIAISMNRWES